MEIMLQNYRFTAVQMRRIVSEQHLLDEFVRLDSLIQKGYVDIKTNPTRYIAGILFKKGKAEKLAQQKQ